MKSPSKFKWTRKGAGKSRRVIDMAVKTMQRQRTPALAPPSTGVYKKRHVESAAHFPIPGALSRRLRTSATLRPDAPTALNVSLFIARERGRRPRDASAPLRPIRALPNRLSSPPFTKRHVESPAHRSVTSRPPRAQSIQHRVVFLYARVCYTLTD